MFESVCHQWINPRIQSATRLHKLTWASLGSAPYTHILHQPGLIRLGSIHILINQASSNKPHQPGHINQLSTQASSGSAPYIPSYHSSYRPHRAWLHMLIFLSTMPHQLLPQPGFINQASLDWAPYPHMYMYISLSTKPHWAWLHTLIFSPTYNPPCIQTCIPIFIPLYSTVYPTMYSTMYFTVLSIV